MLIARVCPALLIAVTLTACSTSQSLRNSVSNRADYERHRMSRLVMPIDGVGDQDSMIFEASVSATYSADDPAAEEKRMEWLTSWLEIRKLCPYGFEITDRRSFEMLDYNPAHHDLRYEVRCTPPDLAG